MAEPRRCIKCRWAILQDYGYSNYTTEGTNLLCAGMYHPVEEFDSYYGDAKEMLYAEECQHFEEGKDGPFNWDVDGETDANEMTAEQREAHNLYTTKQMMLGNSNWR